MPPAAENLPIRAAADHWELSALVDGDAEAGVPRELDEAVARSATFAQTYAGALADIDAPGWPRRMQSSPDQRADRQAGSTRRWLLHRHRGPTAARCCSSSGAGRPRPRPAAVFELEWAALPRAAPTRWPALRRSRSGAHYLRRRAGTAPPAVRARGDDPREKAISSQSAWARLFGELASALR